FEGKEELWRQVEAVIELGLHHEQQHQELLLTDIKHLFSQNPLHPVYRARKTRGLTELFPLHWQEFAEGLYAIGHEGSGFAFDNEGPRHREFLAGFRLASRLVSNDEYLAFMEDGGYRRPDL